MAGIIDTIKLGAVLIFAIPAALAGLQFLAAGDTYYGLALLGLAVGLVAIKRFLTLPTDVPSILAKRAADTVVTEPDEGDGN